MQNFVEGPNFETVLKSRREIFLKESRSRSMFQNCGESQGGASFTLSGGLVGSLDLPHTFRESKKQQNCR